MTENRLFFFLFNTFYLKMAASITLAEAYRNNEEGSFGLLNFRDLGVSSADNAEHKK